MHDGVLLAGWMLKPIEGKDKSIKWIIRLIKQIKLARGRIKLDKICHFEGLEIVLLMHCSFPIGDDQSVSYGSWRHVLSTNLPDKTQTKTLGMVASPKTSLTTY